jgi:hypothetical protein
MKLGNLDRILNDDPIQIDSRPFTSTARCTAVDNRDDYKALHFQISGSHPINSVLLEIPIQSDSSWFRAKIKSRHRKGSRMTAEIILIPIEAVRDYQAFRKYISRIL